MSWIDITEGVLPKPKKGVPPYKVGQTLTFDYEGSPCYLKIMRMGKPSLASPKGKIWAKEIQLYTIKEAVKKGLIR